MNYIRRIVIIGIASVVLRPSFAFAALTTENLKIFGSIPKWPAGSNNALLKTVLMGFLNILLYVGSVIAILSIIYGGFLFLTAGGNDEQISKAKRVLIYSVIGIILIILCGYIYMATINAISGINPASGAVRISL